MIKFLIGLISVFTFAISCTSYADDSQNRGSNTWESYYQNTINSTDPRKTLLLALTYFQMENINTGKAADLGAGAGRDTLFLLKSGWQVFALDAEQLSIDIILSRVDSNDIAKLEVMASPFSEMILPKELDLINASYSLPFCNPKEFDLCWEQIVNSLALGGRFCGQFFGKHDEWANNPNLTIHAYTDFMKLFEDLFEIEYLQIEDGLIPSASGKMKHWHVYHVVAKKINERAESAQALSK